MGVAFDKLNFVKRLENGGGFTRPQAETLSEAFHDAVVESVATKQDLGEVRQEVATSSSELRHEMAMLRVELRQEMATLGTELRQEMATLGTELRQDSTAIRSEATVNVADLKASIAESRVWSVGVGATIVAVLAAMKYFG